MTNALFTYRRRVLVNGEEKFNDNFINPLNVTSMFWEANSEGKQILNVFLNAVRATNKGTNAYSITFGESMGLKFVIHMEDFLRYQLGFGRPNVQNTNTNAPERSAERHSRRAIEAEIVDEIPESTAAEWVQN